MAPSDDGATIEVNGKPHEARVVTFAPNDEAAPSISNPAYVSQRIDAAEFEPLALRPSEKGELSDCRIVEEIDLGARLPFTGSTDMNLVGEALHRFLAADDPSWASEKRVALATRLLDAWGVTGFDPRDVVTMGTRFRGFVATGWPGATLRREVPITHRLGNRTLSGRIDAMVETPNHIVVIDHKSFPGNRTQWIEQARKHGRQLHLYAGALKAATSEDKRISLALHLPIGGEILMIE